MCNILGAGYLSPEEESQCFVPWPKPGVVDAPHVNPSKSNMICKETSHLRITSRIERIHHNPECFLISRQSHCEPCVLWVHFHAMKSSCLAGCSNCVRNDCSTVTGIWLNPKFYDKVHRRIRPKLTTVQHPCRVVLIEQQLPKPELTSSFIGIAVALGLRFSNYQP